MIVGNDLSYAQGVIDWNTYKNNTNFVIIQSSYGNGYFDAQYGNNKGQVLQTNLPHGYYHFAYPDLNSPVDEANWFLHALSAIKPLQDGEVLILDYERTCSDNVGWVKTFLDTVSSALGGYKPLLYTYQDMLTSNDFSPVANEGYGLWIAAPTNDPNNNTFQTGAFPFACMQQWGVQTVPGISGQVDADVFFGNADTFLKYGFKSTAIPTPQSQSINVSTQSGPVASQPTEQTAQVSEVTHVIEGTAQTNTTVPITASTNSGKLNVIITATSTQTPQVTSSSETTKIPPTEAKPLPMPTPIKPSMDWYSTIVFLLKNIFNTLFKKGGK